MTRLDRLEVVGFRGVVRSTIPFDGGWVVLGGENGSGKTAFVDALEFLYTGSIGSLSGTTGLGVKQHGGHIRSDAQYSCVTAHFEQPDASATRWLSGTLEAAGKVDEHIQRGSKLTFILRRSQLQSFIHAKPAERYRNLAELIGLARLESLQSVTRRAWDSLQKGVLAIESEIEGLDEADCHAQADYDEAVALAELNKTLAELGLDRFRIASLDDIAPLRSELLQSVSHPRADDSEIQRGQLLASISRASHERLLRNLSDYLTLLENHDDGQRQVDLEELNLLAVGREVLRHEGQADKCPLCESNIDARRLLADLSRRIRDLEQLNMVRQQIERARQDLESSLQDSSLQLRNLRPQLLQGHIPSDRVESLLDSVTMLRESVGSGAPAQVRQMAQRLQSAFGAWQEWRDGLVNAMTPDEGPAPGGETDTVGQALGALEAAGIRRAAAMRARSEREERRNRRDLLLSQLKRRRAATRLALSVTETFTRVRNQEIQHLFDELQSDLARFYEFLHPGEAHEALSIAMDLRKRGSTDLRLDFYDRTEQDPRAFISEGHLDSLGLCIFLAFVRRFNGDWPLLVLDDVVSSVDARHKARVARLLFQEFADHQLFITTQDGRWFNEIRRLQTELQRENVQNLVIESWSLENGPAIKPAA
jgi:recombinational DNA repair ATPase RecF